MDEKRLVPNQPDVELTPRHKKSSSRVRKWHIILLIVFVVLWFHKPWKHFPCHHKHHRHHHHHHHHPHHHKDIRKYPGEHLTWKYCDTNDDIDLECSSIQVPLDHFNTTSSNKTFTLPLIRIRGETAKQNILLNPGGPGGSGVEFIYRMGKRLKGIVGEDFHLLGFDPRGVNGSQPAALCYPDNDTRMKRSPLCAADPIRDSAELYGWSQNLALACKETTGEHGLYTNTPQTAADMNSILDAVGQGSMYYWGFSYGTLLGQTYATMFPERSKRVIIDGVADVFDWYDELISLTAFADSENALAGYFDECIKAGDACALSSFAKDKDDLQEKVMNVVGNLKKDPINVYVNNRVYGTLDHRTMLYSIFRVLHKPGEQWYTLAENLAHLLRGNATAAFLAYKEQDWFASEMEDHEATIQFNDARSGKQHWPQGREELLYAFKPYLNKSLFGSFAFEGYYAQAAWSIPQTHTFKTREKVDTKHPLLVLSTTYDPVTPLTSARVARKTFQGSKIVEVKGYGHCSLAVESECLKERVRAFLNDGILPDEDVQCDVDGEFEYFKKPS